MAKLARAITLTAVFVGFVALMCQGASPEFTAALIRLGLGVGGAIVFFALLLVVLSAWNAWLESRES